MKFPKDHIKEPQEISYFPTFPISWSNKPFRESEVTGKLGDPYTLLRFSLLEDLPTLCLLCTPEYVHFTMYLAQGQVD